VCSKFWVSFFKNGSKKLLWRKKLQRSLIRKLLIWYWTRLTLKHQKENFCWLIVIIISKEPLDCLSSTFAQIKCNRYSDSIFIGKANPANPVWTENWFEFLPLERRCWLSILISGSFPENRDPEIVRNKMQERRRRRLQLRWCRRLCRPDRPESSPGLDPIALQVQIRVHPSWWWLLKKLNFFCFVL